MEPTHLVGSFSISTQLQMSSVLVFVLMKACWANSKFVSRSHWDHLGCFERPIHPDFGESKIKGKKTQLVLDVKPRNAGRSLVANPLVARDTLCFFRRLLFLVEHVPNNPAGSSEDGIYPLAHSIRVTVIPYVNLRGNGSISSYRKS